MAVALKQLQQTGAATNQVVGWTGTTWAPQTPGSATVTRAYFPGVVLNDAVYQRSDGQVGRASAGSETTAAFGFVSAIDSPSPGQCRVQVTGDLAGFGGLTAGRVYIASLAAGQILWEADTLNPNYPVTPGNIVQRVGLAASATTLLIDANHGFEEL